MEKQDQIRQSLVSEFELIVWRHLFLIIASGVSLCVLLFVPQVKNISFDSPRPFFDRAFFITSIIVFAFLNITMIINFVNPQVPLLNKVGLGFWRKILFAPAKGMCRLLSGMIQNTSWFHIKRGRWGVSVILFFAGSAGSLAIKYELHTPAVDFNFCKFL